MTIYFNTTRTWTQQDLGYAAARIGHVPRGDVNALYTAAVNAGFTHVGNNAYQHGDGSWIMMRADGGVDRGVGQAALTGMPQQVAATQPPAATWGGTTSGAQYDTTSRPPLPSSQWSWWQQNAAIGQLPMMYSASDARAYLPSYGFTETSSNVWVHPDGSWVNASGGVSLGWKGYRLGELPFNNRTSP